jgi:hypothetical protein
MTKKKTEDVKQEHVEAPVKHDYSLNKDYASMEAVTSNKLNREIEKHVDEFPHAGVLDEGHMKYVKMHVDYLFEELINVHARYRKTKVI